MNVNPISGSFQNISATQAVCTLRLLCIVVASFSGDAISKGKRTPKSVKRRSSRVDFRLRNPSSPDVVLVIKALFSIFDPHNRVETNMYFVFTHVFVLALRYLHFFPLLTYITDSKKFLRCLLFTDGRLQLQHSDTSTKSVKRRMLKHQRSSRVDFWWRNPSSPDLKAYSKIRQKEVISGRFPITKSELTRCCLRDEGPI